MSTTTKNSLEQRIYHLLYPFCGDPPVENPDGAELPTQPLVSEKRRITVLVQNLAFLIRHEDDKYSGFQPEDVYVTLDICDKFYDEKVYGTTEMAVLVRYSQRTYVILKMGLRRGDKIIERLRIMVAGMVSDAIFDSSNEL